MDPDAGVVEVWRPDDERPEIVTDVLTWQVSNEAGRLAIDLHSAVSTRNQSLDLEMEP